tara:strand:+ start:404 stop:676 length:273 start_codon:yes stop_codon:yes gene_type:complete
MAKSKNRDRLDSDNKNLDSWVAHLESTLKEDEIPDGWATVRDVAKATNLSFYTIRGRLERMVQEKKAERKSFLVRIETGIRSVNHYKLNQ